MHSCCTIYLHLYIYIYMYICTPKYTYIYIYVLVTNMNRYIDTNFCVLLHAHNWGPGFFGVFVLVLFFWFCVRGCCKNCKSHKDETNAEAAIGLFGVFFLVLPSWVMQTVQ